MPVGLISWVEQPVKDALCGVFPGVLQTSCLQFGRVWIDNPQVLRRCRPAHPHAEGRTWRKTHFAAPKEAPPHVDTWDGAVAPTSPTRRPRRRPKREVAP